VDVYLEDKVKDEVSVANHFLSSSRLFMNYHVLIRANSFKMIFHLIIY